MISEAGQSTRPRHTIEIVKHYIRWNKREESHRKEMHYLILCKNWTWVGVLRKTQQAAVPTQQESDRKFRPLPLGRQTIQRKWDLFTVFKLWRFPSLPGLYTSTNRKIDRLSIGEKRPRNLSKVSLTVSALQGNSIWDLDTGILYSFKRLSCVLLLPHNSRLFVAACNGGSGRGGQFGEFNIWIFRFGQRIARIWRGMQTVRICTAHGLDSSILIGRSQNSLRSSQILSHCSTIIRTHPVRGVRPNHRFWSETNRKNWFGSV